MDYESVYETLVERITHESDGALMADGLSWAEIVTIAAELGVLDSMEVSR